MAYGYTSSRHTNSNGFQYTLITIGVIILIILSIMQFRCRYILERDILSEWALADRSSTIEAKYQHISKFVTNLENNKSNFSSHDALLMKTDANSFEKNLQALQTLSTRLEQIKTMDSKSFEYQTAIQQITAQEQGEAHELLDVIKECWLLHNCVFAWGWICVLSFLTGIGLVFLGLISADL